jgi:hypothetical protein
MAQLPFWHGFNGLAGGLASLGGGISLAIGVSTSNIPIPELGNPNDWFSRAAFAFMIEAVTHGIDMIYDLITLISAPSN